MSHIVSSKKQISARPTSDLNEYQANPLKSRLALSKHCMATVIVKDPSKLVDVKSFSEAVREILKKENVQCLGQVDHVFSNNSFTSIIALAESHISVHTWPERFAVQLDVFLCNYIHDNRDKCERIFNEIVAHFDPAEVEATFVDRL
jgi:S-adenosylmethionine decarboxylase